MNLVKVKAKIVEDNSGIKLEVPVLLSDNNIILESLLNFTLVLKREGKSESKLNDLVSAVRLLLMYIQKNFNAFDSQEKLFASFSTKLYTGTIGDDGIDPSGLYWFPLSNQMARKYITALTQFTDWLSHNLDTINFNPLVEADTYNRKMNYLAWFRKNQYDFLGHIKNKDINKTVNLARSIKGKKPLNQSDGDAIEFPEEHFAELFLNGVGKMRDYRCRLRDQLILLLIHGGGLRYSEALHLWLDDILIDPNDINNVIVRIYHPCDGKAPSGWRGATGAKTRAAYLRENFAISPRIELLGKKRVGWKGNKMDHRDNYIQVSWFPKQFGSIFAKIWIEYLHIIIDIERSHPYAFFNFSAANFGEPYTLNAFQYNYKAALRRINLFPSKEQGLSPHSHRHSYGRALMRFDVDRTVIQKALHHSSITSQKVYTAPNISDVNKALSIAQQKLDQRDFSDTSQNNLWNKLLEHGFQDIDPDGLFSGKNPKLTGN